MNALTVKKVSSQLSRKIFGASVALNQHGVGPCAVSSDFS
jgi:hypothetical protein